MTGYPDPLDARFGRKVQRMDRSIRRLQSRTAGIDSGAPLAVLPGQVNPSYSGTGNPRVLINGATTLTGPYQHLASYSPAPGDSVLVVPVPATQDGSATSYIVLGSLSGSGGGSGSTVIVDGADYTGTNDSTTQIQEAITAASNLGTGGGAVYVPPGQYKINGILQLQSGVRIYSDSRAGTKLFTTSGSPLFSMGPSSTLVSVEIDHLFLSAANADLFSGANIERSWVHHCQLQQLSAGYSIWNSRPGPGLMVECTFSDNIESVSGNPRTVEAWILLAPNTSNEVNGCRWINEQCFNNGADPNYYWYHLKASTPSGTAPKCDTNRFQDIVWETSPGGLLWLESCVGTLADNCHGWDFTGTYANTLFTVTTNATGTGPAGNSFKNCGRIQGSMASGTYDFAADSGASMTWIEQPRPLGGAGAINLSSTTATLAGIPASWSVSNPPGSYSDAYLTVI